MSEINERDANKRGTAGNPPKLELKKTIEAGQIRQSFAHGRSKMVTVEVRKKRTFATDSAGRMAEIHREAEAALGGGAAVKATQADGVPREGAAIGLTNTEKAARARALQDAMRVEETRRVPAGGEDAAVEQRQAAEEIAGEPETVPVFEGAPAVEAVPSVAPEPEGPTAGAAPAAAPPAPLPSVPVEEAPAPPAVEEAPAPPSPTALEKPPARPQPAAKTAAETAAAAATKLRIVEADEEEGDKRGRAKRPARAGMGRMPAAGRRGDTGRRTAKVSLVDALDEGAERMRSLASMRRAREKEKLKQLQLMRSEPAKVIREVVIPETITVQELANRMAERSADVIKALMRMGVMATINHAIDADTAELVVGEFGHHFRRVSDADVEIGLRGVEDEETRLVPRPPVVTIMGHVDHGKTSLLDALRHTDVAAHEAGGITQHIGAYQVTLAGGERITFIDTPGHAAFTQMRARGANVTDIVVLVVAADDGVMPQTVEAINHAQAAEVPMIVAINKIDRPDANPARVRTELLQHGIVVEEMGGETLTVEVSAKTRQNLDKLTEAILLQAEILDLKANPDRPAEGVILETKIERGRGVVATVLVQRGTLRMGDTFVAGTEWGRVRSLADAFGHSVQEAGPGTPVEVLGLNGAPAAGDDVIVVDNETRAREVTEFRQRKVRDARVATTRGSVEQQLFRIKEGGQKELPVVVKGDVHGSVEAIVGALERLGTEEVKTQVLHAGVGGINESDVTLARASGAVIIGFNVRANPQAREMAKRDGVEIRYYSIIYDLTDDLKRLLSGMLAPKVTENVLGSAEIRQVFTISKVGKVAGCMVVAGIIRRGAKVRLLRDDVVIHEGEIGQLKRFKEDAKEVREGYDCGIALASYQDIQVGDIIECFELEETAREL
jgi:translation initiation factor IF-2